MEPESLFCFAGDYYTSSKLWVVTSLIKKTPNSLKDNTRFSIKDMQRLSLIDGINDVQQQTTITVQQ